MDHYMNSDKCTHLCNTNTHHHTEHYHYLGNAFLHVPSQSLLTPYPQRAAQGELGPP